MKKLLLISSTSLCLALVGVIGVANSPSVGLLANADSTPKEGDFQTAIDTAAASTYTKVSNITKYTGISNYPYSEHNPMTTEYTQEGLYMVERGSGYYTYNNQIWHVKKNGDTWDKHVSMTNYSTYYAYYRTLKDFGGSFVSGNLETDTSDTMKSKDATYSSPDIISMIYFVAPLVTIADGATFSNYSFVFKLSYADSKYVLDSISIAVDITVDSVTASLASSVTFTKIGSTTLDYTI